MKINKKIYNIKTFYKIKYMNTFNNILITGGCGFIGSNFINYMVVQYPDINFYNVDKMDYCSSHDYINVGDSRNYYFYKCNINDANFITHILIKNNIDSIIHFAAQSDVDTSFDNCKKFIKDNVMGTYNLLECSRQYGKIKRFIHISTDEVYGQVMENETACTEESILKPSNPYSASKAAAEMFVKSYYFSHNVPIIITRGNNGYGPNQYPEKLIPKFVKFLLENQKMTIHGDGTSRRNFIHSYDISTAIETILFQGEIGEVYNIGTENEHSVLEISKMLIELIKPTEKWEDWIIFSKNRPFNDCNYIVDVSKLHNLGWKPIINFKKGLSDTIESYLKKFNDNKKYN
jgi:UDP-glucose 4,6-dehydratase